MKRFSLFLLTLLMLATLLCAPLTASAQDSTVYVRKHVSILYDNSGSMIEHGSLKWSYASYAVQMFTGLLNDTDTLSVTFMYGSPLANLDLKGVRQNAVSAVLERTAQVNGNTPIEQIGAALKILEKEGLKPGRGTNDASEQYWLVLTTDGVFTEGGMNLSSDRVSKEIAGVMETYPDLHLVYFGIGTENDTTSAKAVDFRKGSGLNADILNELHSHPGFTAVYAENQGQIVETMRILSNQISGRYTVPNDYELNGSELRLYLSAEGSPIRNIAVMLQESDAVLLSAKAQDGTALTIDRQAEIRYPNNPSYANVSSGTKGGYTALITGPGGSKVPSGTITLTFSEPVSSGSIALMYEPAIYIRLLIERKNDSGQWEELPSYADLVEGDEIRASYVICEDGTGRELDTAKLFGKTEAQLRYNGRLLASNETVKVELGDSSIDVHVSMMDGGYQISTTRSIHVGAPKVEDFTIRSSGPIELRRSDVPNNTAQGVEFSITFRGQPVDSSYTSKLSLKVTGDSGTLKGKSENPQPNVFRFVPQDKDCQAGVYTVHLMYDKKEIASEQLRILPNETTYSAEAGPSISILSNCVESNTDPVSFTVTAHRDEGDEPITAEEAKQFSVRAEGNGISINGQTLWQEGGRISFVLQDANASPGTYDVSLFKGEECMAKTFITVIHHDAAYTVETVVSSPNTVDRYDLLHNTSSVSFIVYEDGVPCSSSQLESMLGRQIIVSHELSSSLARMSVKVDMANGKPAIVCTPTSSTRSGLLIFFHRILISTGMTGLNTDTIPIKLTVDMPHGDEGSGELNLVGYRIIYLIILIVFLAVVTLVGMYLFANLKALRLFKGSIWTLNVRNDDSLGGLRAIKVGSITRVGWGWKPMLLFPINEAHTVNKVRFEASSDTAKKMMHKKKASIFGFHRMHPTVVISGTPAELETYYRADVTKVAASLLEQVKSGASVALMKGDVPLNAAAFFACQAKIADGSMGNAAAATPTSGKKTGKKKGSDKSSQPPIFGNRQARFKISQNMCMVFQIMATGDNESYRVWVYEAARNGKDGKNKANSKKKK